MILWRHYVSVKTYLLTYSDPIPVSLRYYLHLRFFDFSPKHNILAVHVAERFEISDFVKFLYSNFMKSPVLLFH